MAKLDKDDFDRIVGANFDDDERQRLAWRGPEAANADKTASDPVLAWRYQLSVACAREGLLYRWNDAEGVTTVSRGNQVRIDVPDEALAELIESNAHPRAVACMLRAVTWDRRARWWGEDEDEDY